MRTSTRGFILLLLTGLLGLSLGVLPASAHSRLVSISPADGTSLPAAPSEVVLTFNEPVNAKFVTVRVTDAEGGDVTGEDATAQGSTVRLPLSDPLAAGTYNIVYRVVSADSHPISGSTSFTVEGDPLAPPASASPSSSPSEATTASASPSVSASPSAGTSSSQQSASRQKADTAEGDGIPAWVWVLVALGVVGAIGGTLYAVRRDESQV